MNIATAYVVKIAVNAVFDYVFDGGDPAFAIVKEGAGVGIGVVEVFVTFYKGVVVMLPIQYNRNDGLEA